MTGEITLRGRVLPIGGLKEKVLAAHRAELKQVLIPKDNEKDIAEIPKSVLDKVELTLVEHMDDVLRHALTLEDADAFYKKLRGEQGTKPKKSAIPKKSSAAEARIIDPHANA